MNGAHLHLIVNHIPVIGVGVAAFFLILAKIRRSEEVETASLILLVCLAVAAIGVYLTGEPAEEIVRRLPDVADSAIEVHEEAALVALIGLIITGLFAAGALYRWRATTRPQWVASVALILAVVVTGAMGYAANLGGKIQHSEIRTDAPLR